MSSHHNPNQLSVFLSNIAHSYETQIFQEECNYAKGLLDDAKYFERAEMTRLRDIINKLMTENSILVQYDQQNPEVMTAAVGKLLEESPIKSLSSPCSSFYDELAPKLANFIEDNDDYFGSDPEFEVIWKGFGHAQAIENCMHRCTKMIQDLATKNYNLRIAWIRLATGSERERLETISGGPAHPDAFVRSVPFQVHSNQVAPKDDPFAGLRELERLSGDRDLVLKKTLPVQGMERAFYHPLSPVYVPSFLGQGIPTTGTFIELVNDSTIYSRDTHEEMRAPGGSRLWFAKDIETGEKWIL